MRLDRTVCCRIGLLVTLAVVILPGLPAHAQPQTRSGATPLIVDASGKMVGQLLTVNAIGTADGTIHAQVGTTFLRLKGKLLMVGVSDDRFVGAPVVTQNLGNEFVGLPVNFVAFDGAHCTGNPFVWSLPTGTMFFPPVALYGSGLVRRAAIGPGNTLYSEGETVSTVTVQSAFFPFEQICSGPLPAPAPVKSAILEADLDTLFTPPFSLQ